MSSLQFTSDDYASGLWSNYKFDLTRKKGDFFMEYRRFGSKLVVRIERARSAPSSLELGAGEYPHGGGQRHRREQ